MIVEEKFKKNYMNYECDICVIGAGPSGIFTVFEAGMHSFKCVVVDNLPEIGGQCSALYPEKPIYDIPAHPQITGLDLVQNLEKQASRFNPTYLLNRRVVDVANGVATTSTGDKIKAKAFVIAAGGGSFGPNRPPIDGIESFESKSVFYSVTKKNIFHEKNVAIAGGGDSAIDWAINLSSIASKVFLIHRRDKFRASEESLRIVSDLVSSGKIEMVTPYQLHSINKGAELGSISSVVVSNLNEEKKILDCEFLLCFFGLKSDLSDIATWNLDLENGHIKVDPFTMATNVSGVYAVGDVATYKNKQKLILTGFNEAALAVKAIRSYIFPDSVFHFEHSTTSLKG